MAWEGLLGDGCHRLDVVQRAIGIEDHGFEGQGVHLIKSRQARWMATAPAHDNMIFAACFDERTARRSQIPSSLRAFAFSTFGRISSRMSSLAKSASQRSGVMTGQSEPNSILSWRIELM